ncbi:MAG: hypothetical protein HYU57_07070 [Micavibrio aeruginosavorus]|nr:hypothetical protein [Micavibrio aeruginosavorus]
MAPDPKARELVLKARIYRICALIFALVGLIMFVMLYMRHVEGSFLSSLTNPFIITIVVVPFLPAVVLSILAGRLEREYIKKFQQK